jgi:LysM repeat protein
MSCDSDVYIIQDGDTLLGISIKLNVPIGTIKRLNRMFGGDRNSIYSGQVILNKTTRKIELMELNIRN